MHVGTKPTGALQSSPPVLGLLFMIMGFVKLLFMDTLKTTHPICFTKLPLLGLQKASSVGAKTLLYRGFAKPLFMCKSFGALQSTLCIVLHKVPLHEQNQQGFVMPPLHRGFVKHPHIQEKKTAMFTGMCILSLLCMCKPPLKGFVKHPP